MSDKAVVKVCIFHMMESGKGKSWWVEITNSAGQKTTPFYSYEAYKALIEAKTWANFFGLPLELDPEDEKIFAEEQCDFYAQYGDDDGLDRKADHGGEGDLRHREPT